METEETKKTEEISAEEFKKLQEENAKLKKQNEELDKVNNLEAYIDKRIEELAKLKVKEHVTEDEKALAEARALLAKAEENKRIAEELDENRKYLTRETYIANKKKQFIAECHKLDECITNGNYMTNTFDLRRTGLSRSVASIALAVRNFGPEKTWELFAKKTGLE